MPDASKLKPVAGALLGTVAAGLAVYMTFVVIPARTPLSTIGAMVFTSTTATGGAVAWGLLNRPDLDVAAVDIDGQITDDDSPFADGTSAASITEAVETADEDDADALLVRVNSPGGPVGPSERIRHAIEEFDGPTVALGQDTCASGGYLIASACDHIVANDHALVGSIGVIGSRPNVSNLADELGVTYQRFTAGEYKDAGHPLKDPDEDGEAYLQGMIDRFYETFCERVAENRNLSLDDVKATEAKVFVGEEAAENGLVDEVGTEDDARSWLADRLGRSEDSIDVATWEEPFSLGSLSPGRMVQKTAYAFGAGLATRLADDRTISIEYRYK